MFMRWIRFLFLLAIGSLIGIGVGLYLGWQAWPTQFTDANPAALEERYRQEYARMIATTYALDGDLEAARQRTASLSTSSDESYFFNLTLNKILEANDATEIQQFVQLSYDLGFRSPALTPFLPSAESNNNE